MRTGFIRSAILFSHALEFIGGLSSALLGVAIYLRLGSGDSSAGAAVSLSTYALAILMLVVPGLVVLIGSYLHAIRRKQWAVIAVFIGGVANVALIGLNVGLAYAFVQDRVGRIAVFGDCLATVLTMGLSLVNAILSATFKVAEKPRQYG